ncbi:MAG: single-stranded DNA-binding protein [Solobacterium sp.]|jgi:single-strand DNA-binding protein|nr:single-stranded DNA-binding protein [Solobacterium sp.]MCH4205335.1 single-stranded DNA-binding protein [Solobacterium sp.]MCH4226968.1 single-stranded DNA-binding protein [Solobacterium sp.]MCH4282240.1 single-stranded DNA-binding protein [Solobacterium sp.]
MINRVVLVGRLTKDVEIRKTQSQLSVASFTVAVDRRVSRSQDQNSNQPTADFINCVAWRQTADFLGTYAKKGALVGVDGRLQTRTYDDAQGNRHYVTEVVCDNANLLESKSSSQQRAQQESSFQQPSYAQPQPAQNTGSGSNEDYGAASSLDISSDDLPF